MVCSLCWVFYQWYVFSFNVRPLFSITSPVWLQVIKEKYC